MYLSITLTSSAPVAFLSSLTINLNASVVSVDKLDGAVNVAMDVLARFNITFGPSTLTHDISRFASLSWSLLLVPHSN